VSIDRPRGPRYSTSISSAAEQAVALLRENKVEEAAGIVSRFPEGGSDHRLVVEVVDQFLGTSKGVEDSENLFLWLESFPDANSASSDVFHQIFDQLIGHDDGNGSLVRRFGLLCASKGYQDFVAAHVTPVVLRQATDSEAATWGDEVLLAAAEFKGLQGSLEGVLEEDGLDYALAPPTVAQMTSTMQQVEETLPAVLPATSLNEDLVFEEDGPEYVASVTPLYSGSTQSRVDRVMEDLMSGERWGEAHTFLLEIQQTGRLPPAAACTTAIQTLLDQLLDPTIPSEDKLTTRPQYLDWVRALPPALSHENVPFAKHLVDILFRPDISVSPLARDTAVALASRGYLFSIVPHIIRIYCTHPDSRIPTAFVDALEKNNREFNQEYHPTYAEERTRSLHLKIRSSIVRTLATFGSFSHAMRFFPERSEGFINGYEVLLRQIRASGPAAAPYEKIVLSRIPERPDPTYAPLPDEHSLAAQYDWLSDAFVTEKPSPHPMIILDFINAFQASNYPNSHPLTQLLNKAMVAGPLHASAFLYAEMLYYYREENYRAVLETTNDHAFLGCGIPRHVVETLRWRMEKGKSRVESSYRFHENKSLKIPYKIWAPSPMCNIFWHTVAAKTLNRHSLRNQYDWLVKTLEQVKIAEHDGRLRAPGAKSRLYPNGDAFIPFMKKFMEAKGPQAGTAVINDIVRLGLQVKTTHFSELAHAYAMSGAPGPAFTILRKLEAGFATIKKMKEGEKEPKERLPYGSPQNVNTLPLVPDVHMFAYLARAFIKTGRIEDAETVLSEMDTYLKEEAEVHWYVKKVRASLENLKIRLALEKAKKVEVGEKIESVW
jgi:hypothetical protein